jgi:peptidoglycan-associated lipoprotein
MKHCISLVLITSIMLSTGCTRQPGDVWDDTKSCGRHVTRGFKALCGQSSSSRQVYSKDDFIAWQEDDAYANGYQEAEYISFPDETGNNQVAMADYVIPQPRQTPGDPGSSVPGINSFRDPRTVPETRGAFRNITFDYNSNLVRGDANMASVRSAAAYLRSHPNTYVFVEGHCDERGPEAYNLALGARRSNAVRAALVEQGVNPERVFTISYGAERPHVQESHEDAWSQNRRAEFKIYE